MKTALKATLVSMVLLLLAGLSTAFYVRESRARRRAAWEALDRAQRLAAAADQAVRDRHAEILAETARCAGPAADLSNTVRRVLGRGLETGKARPAEPKAAPKPESKPEVKPDPKPAPEPPPAPVDDAVPFGGPSREELERLRRMEQERPPAPEPDRAPVAPAMPTPAVRAPTPEPEPLMVTAARQAVLGAAEAAGIAATANEVMTMAAPIRARMAQTVSPDDLVKLAQRMDQHRVSLDGLLARAREAWAGIEAAQATVEREERRIEQERRETEQAEAARRAEAALQALMKEEKARAEMTRQRLAPLIRQYRFAEILSQLEAALPGYQTDSGRAPLEHWRERVRRLSELRAFIIAQSGKEPYRWGWADPYGARDILAVGEDVVKLAGKPPVAWADVPLPQTLKMLDHYATRPGITTRAQGGLYLAAAILCEEWGDRLRALDYRRRMLDVASYMAGEFDRLLPDLK